VQVVQVLFTWNQHVKKKSQSDNKLKPARLVKECTVSARLSAAAPSAPIGLLLRYNVCNVLFWLQIRHKHTLTQTHLDKLSIEKQSGGANVIIPHYHG
jgi:hypothetical protein